MPDAEIRPAQTPADIAAVRALFDAYAASLDVDLAYQGFAAELAALPGDYAPPTGALLLARNAASTPLGCVALRRTGSDGACEMKRLYVTPAARGTGLGRALMQAIIAAATHLGYRSIQLDTLPGMTGAIALYQAAGFTPIPPYYATPISGTLFLARPLPN